VVQKIENQDEQTLVSFDMMFEGIRNELRAEVQHTIILAEKNIVDNPFAIRVLKALFLVKYFNSFKTTKRNISVLMTDNFRIDLKKHDQKIDEALNLLEHQSYIQRNGGVYEFLTDDEKDIEQAIKETDLDNQEEKDLLKRTFFDELIKDSKIKFSDNKQSYEFTAKIDGSFYGKEKELEIEIITEAYHDYCNESYHQHQTMGSNGMKVVLPANSTFMKDLNLYLKTEKYIKRENKTTNKPEVKRILSDKLQQNAERKKTLIKIANQLLATAAVYMNGQKHEMGQHSDGRSRIVSAFQDLIKIVYTNLRMLGSVVYSEETVKTIVRNKEDDLFKNDDTTLSEAESEVLSLINRRKRGADRCPLSDLKENFSKKPYGWYANAIWTIIAKLYKRGKIEVKQDSNLLDDKGVETALLNSSKHGNTLVEIQADIDVRQVKKLKDLYAEAFNESCAMKDARDVANDFKKKLDTMLHEVKHLLSRKKEYPFLAELEQVVSFLERLQHKEYTYFLLSIKDFEDQLLDYKEDLLDPIKQFMNSEQKEIYDTVKHLLNIENANINYVESGEVDGLKELLADAKPYLGSKIRDAKKLKDDLLKKITAKIEEERTLVFKEAAASIQILEDKEDYKKLKTDQQEELKRPLQKEQKMIAGQKNIAYLRDFKNRIHDDILPRQLNKMAALAMAKEHVKVKAGANGKSTYTSKKGNLEAKVSEPKIVTPVYIKMTDIKAGYHKNELTSEQDAIEYTELLKQALIEQIRQNKRIHL